MRPLGIYHPRGNDDIKNLMVIGFVGTLAPISRAIAWCSTRDTTSANS